MDHVDLTPYPFPKGMAIPRLMPFQEFPWNGDGYLAAEVLRLKEAHGLSVAIETGTCLGSTTCWLAENFDKVLTCDVNEGWIGVAIERTKQWAGKVWVENYSSTVLLNKNAPMGFYFLDAHWNDHCPLLDEFEAIAKAGVKPCIVIHDFWVPGTNFGFDRFPDTGDAFCLDVILPHLDAIYGHGGWNFNYPTKVEGARRGWISIEPATAPAPAQAAKP